MICNKTTQYRNNDDTKQKRNKQAAAAAKAKTAFKNPYGSSETTAMKSADLSRSEQKPEIKSQARIGPPPRNSVDPPPRTSQTTAWKKLEGKA